MSAETMCAICGHPVRVGGMNHFPANLKQWGYGGEFAHPGCFSAKVDRELADRVAGNDVPNREQWNREALEMLKDFTKMRDPETGLVKCPCLFGVFGVTEDGEHREDCALARLIRQGERL